ncbi:peroxidase family protein [Engelhardtia mirabilis]|uniref:Peroxidase n=1 Tax=Engelhardtia mirabilis TaxID=2528011 RepID=A0A518BGH8_9BACT|nr:peroxidase [Planctomycetes bacterium Pla133]QDV00425.1 peroxidase [Planctomycetes bacterium Pla86]
MRFHFELIAALVGAGTLALSSDAAAGQRTQGPAPDDRSPVQRGDRVPPAVPEVLDASGQAARFPLEFRAIDGVGNSGQPRWGASGAHLARLAPPDYADGASSPAGADRPSARLISNLVCAQGSADRPNDQGLSDFVWQWGQFLDHDLTETPVTDPGEPFEIEVPAGDPWFDPDGTGAVTIPLDRSAYRLVEGVREQLNNITAAIDGSQVYGSDAGRARALRTLDGTGRLATSSGDLLPFNSLGLDNAPTSAAPSFFLAGDIRANEQVGLTAMHTLFVREHNRVATLVGTRLPFLTGDQRYQFARAIVAAELQAVTYGEFLPRLLGADALPPYAGYRPDVDPTVTNVFATAAYRVGHTMLSDRILRLDADGLEHPAGHLPLAKAFFAPREVATHGIEPVLRGLAAQRAQQVDVMVIDSVRNFLFGPPGAGGFDLASLNIQRGRDHGLPSYNGIRRALGLAPATSFGEVCIDPVVVARLEAAYGDVERLDAWVGLLAEPHLPGAFVGETLAQVLRDQFTRLRDGDRFWYESYLPSYLADEISGVTLAQIIRLNTDIGDELPDDVFAPFAATAKSTGARGLNRGAKLLFPD